MKKKILAMLLLPMAALTFAACGGDEEAKTEGTSTETTEGAITNGLYEVETKDADENGGKARASVKFEGGKIVEVKYNEFTEKGDKREDAGYNEMMQEKAGTSPAKYEVAIEEAVMAKQSAEFDAVSGATSSSAKAKTLISEAITNANEGNTEKELVEVK
ncbi:FMN-binding protein [uncultured Clostridium sp.]|jgi:major membrane immunogen (membrane-anchored lipoprotein)|uniref:FMN-binding protein n=1 Tax=uncultured Clostridium sp. TaxID=59620 RepID=UPI0026285F40|nr:FMN-binding protein [uncultured Clostridium sp.]